MLPWHIFNKENFDEFSAYNQNSYIKKCSRSVWGSLKKAKEFYIITMSDQNLLKFETNFYC